MLQFARLCLFALLAWPAIAQAQFTLVATQLGERDEAAGASYAGLCAPDACRVTLPIRMFGIGCVLNIRVSAPTKTGVGNVLFAAGPCEHGYRIPLGPGNSFSARYELESLGAMSRAYDVPIGSSANTGLGNGMDDGVVHPFARVRLDLIATYTH